MNSRYTSAAATGNSRPTRLFSSNPIPRLAAITAAQSRGLRLLFIQRAQKRPHGERDGRRQHHVRNQDAREQKQPDACGDSAARHRSPRACPNAHVPNAAVSQRQATHASATGMRAAQSKAPKIL